MFGWLINNWIFISRTSCYNIFVSLIYLFDNIFILHNIRDYFYAAKTTRPKVPFPISFIIIKSWIETCFFDKISLTFILFLCVLTLVKKDGINFRGEFTFSDYFLNFFGENNSVEDVASDWERPSVSILLPNWKLLF